MQFVPLQNIDPEFTTLRAWCIETVIRLEFETTLFATEKRFHEFDYELDPFLRRTARDRLERKLQTILLHDG